MLLTTEDLVGLAPYIGVALIAYILRLVLSRKKVRITEAILDAVAALASGAFIGATITIYPFPGVARVAIAGMAGFIGPDLIAGLLAITKAFKDSPDRFILQYIYAFKGVKTGMDIPATLPPAQPPIKEQPDQPT